MFFFLVGKYSKLFTLIVKTHSCPSYCQSFIFHKQKLSNVFRRQQQLWNQIHLGIVPFVIQVQDGSDESIPV